MAFRIQGVVLAAQVVLVASALPRVSCGQELQKVREAVNGPPPTPSDGSETNNDDEDEGPIANDDPDASDDAMAAVIVTFLGILSEVQNPDQEPGTPGPVVEGFLPYPYAAGYAGHLLAPDMRPAGLTLTADASGNVTLDPLRQADVRSSAEVMPREFSLRLATSYVYAVDSNLHLPDVSFMLEHVGGFGCETTWSGLFEPLDHGGLDQLVLGTLDASFRFIDHPKFEARVGAGGLVLIDPTEDKAHQLSHWGLGGLLGVDIFPTRPFAISLSALAGNLGQAFFIRGRASVGVMWSGAEIFLGLEAMSIEEVTIFGPLAGVRFWI